MTRSALLLIATASVLALAAFLSPSAAQAPARAAAPTRVAVCDVVMAFNNYERARDLTKQFEAEGERIKQLDADRAQAIQKLRERLDALAPGSKEYKARLEELEGLADEQEVWRGVQNGKILRRRRERTEEMYGEILDAIAEVAKERGFDIVIYREAVDVASQTTAQLLQKIALRKCLYARPALDLTQAVLERANQNYRARAK